MKKYIKKKIKRITFSVLISALIGIFFGIMLFYMVKTEENIWGFIFIGANVGFFISLFLSLVEEFWFKKLQNTTILFRIIIKPLIFSIIIISTYALIYYMLGQIDNIMKIPFLMETLIFSLIISFIVNIFETINRLLGQKALYRLFFGKYHTPVKEKRFIMFLDIAGSTDIAEKIGDEKFHGFIREFFSDITNPILEKSAEIYKYVGDEVILTWIKKDGIKNFNVLDLIFEIEKTINQRSKKYMEKYGRVPEFRAGLHFGELIVGEMGEYKMEVAFLGDSMNTAARIQSICKDYNSKFLISENAKKQFEFLENKYEISSIGDISLKGKDKKLKIFNIIKRLFDKNQN
ncbi:MAG: adenylate/guanylate cyclase domain-containing protein [Fusobacteriota bacterium]